ncbi:two-component sensor histidine kinase [Enterococcus sp. JM4C]|nr:two-component sensor histidine kinase [Enterococcus sp. JM4C]
MTIKSRLFISHLLMIVIPVLLSLLVASFAFILVWQYFWGVDEGAMNKNREFRSQYAAVESLVIKWSSDEATDKGIISDMQKFYESYYSDNIALTVYQGENQIHSVGEIIDQKMTDTIHSEEGEHSYLKDQIFVTSFEANRYKVILVNNNYYNDLYYQDPLWDRDYQAVLSRIILVMIIGTIAIIILTNRYLTKTVTKSIVEPLEILTDGFHKIQAGELNYQIRYAEQDEFLPVVKDFNGMAYQLKTTVETQTKLETNRRELVAGISHDLRTPLTSIKAYLEGLEKGVASTPQMREKYFTIIKNKIDDLDQIIAQLFLFSKLDTGEFPFNLIETTNKKLIDETIHFMQHEYEEKGMVVYLDAPDEEVLLEIDPVQFRTVLTNLFENARKYVDKEEVYVTLTYRIEGDQLLLSITDNGSGIATKKLDTLFELFYRDDKSRTNPSQGNGLGLAISKKIIEGMNGKIQARNHSFGGLTILITLPVKKGEIPVGDEQTSTDY